MEATVADQIKERVAAVAEKAIADWWSREHTDEEIARKVRRLLDDRYEATVMKALGLRKSGYGGGWELDEHSRVGVMLGIQVRAAEVADGIAKRMLDGMPVADITLTPAQIKTVGTAYRTALVEATKAAARKAAEEAAVAALAALGVIEVDPPKPEPPVRIGEETT